ncbi:MAG: UDP-glucose/GDP-mannose dehydrogenase family protein [Spirochaetales bacterium]|nr:UDP-glucose/GDP-mannose dehydrogenase family protein [Spirochaetales bacterium]
MNIAVIGTGYVGLVSGACFAEVGNRVTCVDVNEDKIEKLKKGIIPIYEPGLEEMVLRCHKHGDLHFSTSLKEAIQSVEVVFIAVGTPMGDDGSADLTYVLGVAKEIGQSMTKELIVVDKSTVPVGTADKVKATISAELKARKVDIPFHVVSNPEFLKEGNAVRDFMYPDRVVIGSDSEEGAKKMKALYGTFTFNHDRVITMDIRSAEMTKYAANCMLATKISFINEIANICERVGADANKVRLGIGSDGRIGYSFIYPGAGYGGSCFPKDVNALIKTSRDYGYTSRILEAVDQVNQDQKKLIPAKVVKRFGEDLSGMTFGLWGLTFKPNTDDMREAPSITLIKELTSRGAKVQAYDPEGREQSEGFYLKDIKGLEYCDSKYDALKGAEAMILLTEWKEFRSPDYIEMSKLLKNKIIIDGRNQYDPEAMKEYDWEYHFVGEPGEI